MSQVTGSPAALALRIASIACLGRDMRDVVAGAGDLDEAQVAFDHDQFGHRRDRRQAEPGRDLALGDLAGGGEARFLRVLDHELVEAAGIGQEAPHDERVRDRLDPIGKADRAVRGQQPDLGQLASLQPLGRGGVGVDFGELHLARAPRQEFDDRDVVDRRLGVGQRHQGRDAAGRRGPAAAFDRLHVLGAGLAQLHAHIDEAGRETQAGEIDGFDIAADLRADSRPERRDAVALDQQIAALIEPALRVEQPRVAVQAAGDGHVAHHPPWPGLTRGPGPTDLTWAPTSSLLDPSCVKSWTAGSSPARGALLLARSVHP